MKALPKIPRVVIVGGGFGGVEVAKRLVHLAEKGHIWITLINRSGNFLFTPLLHEVAAGSLSGESVVEPLRQVFEDDAVRIVEAEVTEIRTDVRAVRTSAGEITYDYLVVASGSTTNFFGVPGAEKNSLTLKDIDDARVIRNRILDIYQRAESAKAGDVKAKSVSVVVVGGGPTGVELSAELAELCHGTLHDYYSTDIEATVTLISSDPEPLIRYSKRTRTEAARALRKVGVDLHTGCKVIEVMRDRVIFEQMNHANEKSTTTLESDLVIWAAGVKPSAPVRMNLPLDQTGRIVALPTLQAEGNPNVFVLGDIAAGAPMLAQVAVQQGKVVAENLSRLIDYDRSACGMGKRPADVCAVPVLKEYKLKLKGMLVSLGKFNAAGEAFGIVITGVLGWFLWRTIYLFKFNSWRKRFRIMFEWTINLFTARDISR
jgi:NADH dehydrogenase